MNVRRLLPWMVVLWCIGCAHGPRAGEPQVPQYEHVFQKPLPEALAATRELLASHGHTFEDTADPSQLLTTWKKPDRVGTGDITLARYLVTGIAVSPRQSVVRIFRMVQHATVNDIEYRHTWWKVLRQRAEYAANPFEKTSQVSEDTVDRRLSMLRGLQRGTRDLGLERELTLRLESGPSVEVVSGNLKQDLPPPPVRDADFYLARWKDEPKEAGRCGEAVRGLRDLLIPGLTLIIGEQLGSREAPAVVGDVVCQMAEAGVPVVLGLSIPRSEQERLDRYLGSPGAPADQDALLEGRFWRRPYQDGRSSRAILDLVDRVRAMRAAGLRVTLVAYDTDLAGGSERDAALAEVWTKRRAAQPEEVHIVLAGNTHTRTSTGTAWDRDFTPMAHFLKDYPLLIVLEMSYAQGTRWGCNLNREGKLVCGIVGATPTDRVAALPGQTPYIQRFESASDEGFHGLLYVGELSPSLPAVAKEQVAPRPSSIPKPPPVRERALPIF